MEKIIKVQFISALSADALIEQGFEAPQGKCLTIHARSDQMKARVLEQIAAGSDVVVSVTTDHFRNGSWFEELATQKAAAPQAQEPTGDELIGTTRAWNEGIKDGFGQPITGEFTVLGWSKLKPELLLWRVDGVVRHVTTPADIYENSHPVSA